MQTLHSRKRPLLFIIAIGNFIGALGALVSPAFFFSQFFKFPPDPASTFPYLAMYHYCFWGFVLIMGVAYWMAAMNPEQNRIVLLIGGLGKLLAVAFWGMLYAQGHGSWLMLAGALWDGPLGVLLLVLYSTKPTVKEAAVTN